MKTVINYCKRSLLGMSSLFIVFCVSVSHFAVYSQNIPQQGMTVKGSNFVSFRQPQQAADLSEWRKFNDPSDYDHPEFGILVEDAPCASCVEVLSKRKIDERYFVNTEKPSEFYQQKALGDLNMLVNGDWVTIDHSLHPSGATVFESGYGIEQAVIDAETKRTYIKTPSGPVFFNNWKLVAKTGTVETDHGSADWSNYTVGSDGMLIHDVFPGIDAEIRVYRGTIKTNFILRANMFGTFDELIFRDEFSAGMPTSVNFSTSAALSEGVGELGVFSGNTELLHVGESILFARNGPKELVQSGIYRLNGNQVDVVVPFSWINSNIGNYELVVDPAVTGTATLAQASITGSRYNASCNFTNSCDYTLSVPRPANATISDVAWTFSYTANGTTCWLQDGAIRIGVGSCVSPATSGYYWFCNSVGGGTCTGTNQTIFSDVSSCIPAPGCTAQNVTFTLMFYRSCWGASGCSNTCIGAGSPWTMTITGNTLAYSNTASPITLSANTVCQGGSITATTSGMNGVPGYSYNWSFNSSGTPSVGTGASTSITFPSSGSVTLYSIVTDACGNSVNSSSVVTVTPGPAVTVSPSTTSICTGASATLTASGATSYTWSPSTGLSSTTGASVTANPSSTTTYTVTGTSSGCSGTATSTVTVNPAPVVTVNSPTICAGASATLTASGATSYTWSPSTGLSSTTGASVTANPSSTTTYTVTGTSSGCSSTATSTVTVNPAPVVTVNSPTICGGASATLTASGATSYTWSPSAGLSSTTGASVTANPSSTTTYTVTGTSSGCSGTATSTVTVNPAPVVTVNSPTICAGASATLTASGATSYTWSPSTGLSSTTGASVTANPSSTTTYTVTGTSSGCSGTATSTVTVNPAPVVTVNSPTICAGASATLTASGATSYTWSPSTGLSSTTGASVTANPSSTTTYTVTGTSSGCSGTATSTVTVNPAPVVTVNSPTICAGASATLTASGATSYTWSPSAGLSSTTGASVTANSSSTTTYTVTGTSSGCSGTATSTVTVNPAPVVTVNSPTICAGASATLTASGATSYTWSPSTGLSSTTGASVTANPSSTTTYTVTGTSLGCSGTATSTVTVSPAPVITVNSPTICAGASATLTASGATSYTWSPSAGLSSTTGASVTANPSSTTTYTVTGTSSGCSGTATSTVTVNPAPVITVNSPTICAGASATLTASGATSYTWSPSAGLSSTTGASVTANPSSTTTYTVTGTSSGCSGTATSTVTVNPSPVVTASNNGPLCPGDALNLSAVSGTGATYSWSGPASFSSSSQNPVVNSISSANAGTYIVQATINGCSSSTTTVLTMNPLVSTTIDPAGPFCYGDLPVQLVAATPGGIWSGSGITDPAAGTFDPSAATTGSNTITYEIPGSCSDVSTASIVVNPIPAVTFSADKTTGCLPLAVHFTNTSSSGGTLLWNFGGVTEPGNGSGADFTFDSEGCYTISLVLTDANGCQGQSEIVDMICVSPTPNADFTAASQDASIFYPVFQFMNNSANSTAYSWNFGDGTGSSATNPGHTFPEEAGSYEVWLYASNSAGCTDSTSQIVTVTEDVVFYVPNSFTPNGDEHNNVFQPVLTAGFDKYSYDLTIYNRWGEILFESKDASVGWDGTYQGVLAQEGTYVWTVQFRARNNDKKYKYSGSFTLFK